MDLVEKAPRVLAVTWILKGPCRKSTYRHKELRRSIALERERERETCRQLLKWRGAECENEDGIREGPLAAGSEDFADGIGASSRRTGSGPRLKSLPTEDVRRDTAERRICTG